jgi:DNA-binding transcriptional LysR family regulator
MSFVKILISKVSAQKIIAIRPINLELPYGYSYNGLVSNLDGIEVFVRVVQAGSFSAAARLLRMPVTTVSGQVASLEKRLGVTLIQRTTRKLNITKAGEAYFKHCILALDEINAAERELATEKSEPEGLLRIAVLPYIGHTILPSIIRNYLKVYSKVKIEMMFTNRLVDLVGEGIDLAIRVGALKDSTLIVKKFMDADLGLWASTAYVKKFGLPKHPKDFIKHSLIGMTSFSHLTLTNGKQSEKLDVSPRIVVDDIEAVRIFVAGGDGIGLLPSFICENEVIAGKFVRVLPGWNPQFGATIKIWFVYPPQRFMSPKIQTFIAMAKGDV